MRGNRLARGGDPMKTRRERRVERQRKIAKTKRAQRLRKRLGHLAAKNFTHQEENHMTAIMESYILRRKAERKKERAEAERLLQSEQVVLNSNFFDKKQCKSNHSKKADANNYESNNKSIHKSANSNVKVNAGTREIELGKRQTQHSNVLQSHSRKPSAFSRSLY